MLWGYVVSVHAHSVTASDTRENEIIYCYYDTTSIIIFFTSSHCALHALTASRVARAPPLLRSHYVKTTCNQKSVSVNPFSAGTIQSLDVRI